MAIQDEGSRFARPVYSALRRLGARGRLLKGFRHSFALVGHAGRRKPRWVRHVQRPRYRGPSVISTTITLSGGDYSCPGSTRSTLILHRSRCNANCSLLRRFIGNSHVRLPRIQCSIHLAFCISKEEIVRNIFKLASGSFEDTRGHSIHSTAAIFHSRVEKVHSPNILK